MLESILNQSSIQIDPELLGGKRETVFVYHDESTVHAKERPRLSWLMPGTTEFRSKDSGRLIHISDFICKTTGRLVVTQDCVDSLISKGHQPVLPSVSDAAVVIHPGSKGDAWWDMKQLISQIKTQALPIFEAMHPDCQGVFIFDCSSAHEAYGPNALRVQSMSLSSSGKQGQLRPTIIPSDNPHIPIELRGQTQLMVFPPDHHNPKLRGEPKGMKVVLQERGLWDYYQKQASSLKRPSLNAKCSICKASGASQDAKRQAVRQIQEAEARGFFVSEKVVDVETELECKRSDCCWYRILSLQSDFMNEKPLLQMVIEEAGHICLFLPKFHCDLNPIELFWSYIKDREFSFIFYCLDV